MKGKSSKKSDSFDIIRLTSHKPSSLIYSVHLKKIYGITTKSPYSPDLHLALKKQKHFIELPKIHSYSPQKNKAKENETDYILEKSRFYMLGEQPKLQSEKKFFLEDREEKHPTPQSRRKIASNKDNFLVKKVFVNSILYSLGIAEVINEKKKIFVFVEEGNNSRMVKEIFRKRPQVTFIGDKNDASIIWTRFCDYECSKLSSRFTQQTTSQNIQKTEHLLDISKKKLDMAEIQVQKLKEKIVISELKYHNHLQNHYQISDKKSLFSNLHNYANKQKLSLFSMVPQTFQLTRQSLDLPDQIQEKGLWVVKPGEDTNRGEGITIAMGRNKIISAVQELIEKGKTALVQRYIEPLLYKNRKFDIRSFVLVVSYRGELKAYWYREGYLRTCSKEFNWDPNDVFAHLTNDAIQKKCPLYGKYEQGNKLSFSDLEYLLKGKDLLLKQIIDEMKKLAFHSIKSAEHKLRCEKNQFSFEIFGYDFLIDKKGKPWLIEINTNPCLQFTGSLTSRIIWHMVDNSLKICVDPLIGDSSREDQSRFFEDNKFECLI